MKDRYKSIVYEKSNPSNRKEVIFTEKIKGKWWGYNSLVETYKTLNTLYPEFIHIAQKL